VDFENTTSVTVTGAPSGSTVTTTATGATVYRASWPEGVHTLVFRGIKAGCPDCVYTIRVTSTALSGTVTEFVNTNPTITSCGQTSGALRVVGTPGMQIQIVTSGSTNIPALGGLGCGEPPTPFGPVTATYVIPPSGILTVGGGSPSTNGILNVNWSVVGTGLTATAAYNVPCSPTC
jgi:hypothetical protein